MALQFGKCALMVYQSANSKNKEGGFTFYRGKGGVGKGCDNQGVHWRNLGVQSMEASHQLGYSTLIGWTVVGREVFSFCWIVK